MIHLYKGEDYRGISNPSSDNHYHIYIPYLFGESELVEFMKDCLHTLQVLSNDHKVKAIGK